MKIALLTDDRLGPCMAGTALRTWEIARVLQSAGHEVSIVASPSSESPGPGPRLATNTTDAELLIAPPWILRPRHLSQGRFLVLDATTPLLAELDAMPDEALIVRRRRTARARLPLACARADAVLVAGGAQEKLWRRRLDAAGRSDTPILQLPYGLPEEPCTAQASPPPGLPDGWHLVLWWGGAWPWLDLDTLLAARALLGESRISVAVPVARRPGGAAPGLDREGLLKMAARHGLEVPQVLPLETWVPYAERGGLLRAAAMLAVLHRPGREASLSFRTRAMDGLWAGVPLLLSEDGEVAEICAREGLGKVTPPGDASAVAAAIESLISDGPSRGPALSNAAATRSWRLQCQPLLRWIPQALPEGRTTVAAWVRAGLHLAGWRGGDS